MGFPSSHDIACPTTYVQTIPRLLVGLSKVSSIPSLVSLELCDCPFTHILEVGRSVDKTIASQAIGIFKRLKLTSMNMAYTTDTDFWRRRDTAVDLLDVFKTLPTSKASLYPLAVTRSSRVLSPLLDLDIWLRQNSVYCLLIFGSFITETLQQPEVLIIAEGHISEPGSWTEVFEVWTKRKLEISARGQPLKLVVLRLIRLLDEKKQAVPLPEVATVTYELCPASYAYLPSALFQC